MTISQRIFGTGILTSLLFVTSCSDDAEPKTPNNPDVHGEFMNCRVTLMERENFDDHVYSYNDDGKLIMYVFGNSTYEYTYGGNVTTIKWHYSGELQRTETVMNNDAGFATSVEAVYENGITPTRTTIYLYNEKNELVKKTVKDEGETDEDYTVYQWMDGNMIAESDPDDEEDITTYTYTDELTQPSEWFNEINLERGYITIINKNRVSKITNPNGTTFSHSYNEDDDGRIESITISPSNNNAYTKEFSYACD